MKKILWVGLSIHSIVIMIIFSSCRGVFIKERETIIIGLPRLEQNALTYIADSQDFFARNGLEPTVKEYDSGVATIQALLDGEVDIAQAAEFPFVRTLLRNEPIQIIASSDKFENDYLAARKDRGIESLSDLKGKRIGVTFQTINEFYLGRLLELNGINMQDVTLVNIEPAQFIQAITGGEVDAIIAWQPYIHQIEKEIIEINVWPAQSNQAVYGVMIARRDWLSAHPRTVVRFLQSLLAAEDFSIHNTQESKEIVQRRLGYDSSYIESIWPQHEFTLTLDYSLIVAMRDEARWLIDNNLVEEKELPDFYKSVYLNGLHVVKPESMNIVREQESP